MPWTMGHLRRIILSLLFAARCTAPASTAAETLEMPHQTFRLDNGLEVILHVDRAIPQVAVSVWYHVGSGDEFPGKTGFAHLFEHMMFQGTKNTGEDQHFGILQGIGALEINGSTNPNRTNYYEVVPTHGLETALWLESERMGYLLDAVTETSLQNQRDVVRNERRQNYDNVAYGRERFAVAHALYPVNHPYRDLTIGRHEDIEGGSLEDVKGFFRTWYTPSNATLTLAGDFNPVEARRLIEKWFGTFPKLERPARREVSTPVIDAARRVTLHDPMARLRRVHYAWISPANYAPGDAELNLLASALGAEGTGRLYRRLVLETRLAQSVQVYQRSLQRSSEYHVVMDLTEGADASAAEKIVEEELEKVRRTPLSEVELRRAITNYETQFVWGLESLIARAEALQGYNHFLGSPDRLDWDLERYRTATAEGVRAAAAKYLGKAARAEIVTLPGEGQDAQTLEQIAFGAALPAPPSSPAPQIAAVGASAFPIEEFRRARPQAAAVEPWSPPTPEHFSMPPGLEVYLLTRKQIPALRLQWTFEGGTFLDPAGKEGLSELCADVLDDATAKRDTVAFQEALADLGSTLEASVAADRQDLELSTLKRHLAASLDLAAEALTHPGTRAEDLTRDAEHAKAQVRQAKATPATLFRRVFGTAYYGAAHPVAKTATEDSIAAIGPDDCRRSHASWLRPGGSRLMVVGDVTRAELEPALTRAFREWSGARGKPPGLPPAAPAAGRLYLVDVPGAAQSVIAVGEVGPSRTAPDYVPTYLGVSVLGGDFSSRVNMRLREEKGYAYGAFAFVRYFRGDLSILRAQASVRSDATREAFADLVSLTLGVRDGVTAEELERTRSGEILGLPERYASSEAALQTIDELAYHQLPLDDFSTYAKRVAQASREDIGAALRSHIRPAEFVGLVVGDAKLIEPGLRELIAGGLWGDAGKVELVKLDADGRPLSP